MRDVKAIKASVIVVSYNRKEILKYCLQRLLSQTTKKKRKGLSGRGRLPDYEVIVVDDGSTDGTSNLPEIKKVKYIKLPAQHGQPYARNIGIKEAKGEIIVFVDSDVIVAPDFVEDHIKLHINDSLIIQGLVRHIRKPQDAGKFSLLIDGLCLTGLITQNVSIRKEWLLKVGGFDESFGKTMGYMDVDIGIRLRELGLRTRYAFRRCKAWHIDSPPTEANLRHKFQKTYERARNAMLLAQKYGKSALSRFPKPTKVLFISRFFGTQKWAESEEKIKFLTHLHDFPLPLFPIFKEIMKHHYRAKGIIEVQSPQPAAPSNTDSENSVFTKYDAPLPTKPTYRGSRGFRGEGVSPLPLIFLSNGYGEDRSAAIIASEVKRLNSDIKVMGAPLLSSGEEYEKRGIQVVVKGRMPPSGGFPRDLSGLKDIPSFYIPIKYCLSLRKIRDKVRHGVVVGDIFLLVLGWLGLRRKLVFFANTKSDYQLPHFKLEKWIMQRLTLQVFTHDELTAKNLRKERIKASFFGNPMVDGLEKISNLKSQILNLKNLVGILPGSRKEAYKNFLKILEVVELLSEFRIQNSELNFAAAIPSTLNLQKLVALSERNHWQYKEARSQKSEVWIQKGKAKVCLLYDAFVNVVKQSDVIIGLAGTANEQASALSKPIISFKGCGPQTSITRLKNQEKLLGGCLKFVNKYPGGVVDELMKLLMDRKLRARMGKIGVQRMGPPGGAKKIALFIQAHLWGGK